MDHTSENAIPQHNPMFEISQNRNQFWHLYKEQDVNTIITLFTRLTDQEFFCSKTNSSVLKNIIYKKTGEILVHDKIEKGYIVTFQFENGVMLNLIDFATFNSIQINMLPLPKI